MESIEVAIVHKRRHLHYFEEQLLFAEFPCSISGYNKIYAGNVRHVIKQSSRQTLHPAEVIFITLVTSYDDHLSP